MTPLDKKVVFDELKLVEMEIYHVFGLKLKHDKPMEALSKICEKLGIEIDCVQKRIGKLRVRVYSFNQESLELIES